MNDKNKADNHRRKPSHKSHGGKTVENRENAAADKFFSVCIKLTDFLECASFKNHVFAENSCDSRKKDYKRKAFVTLGGR